MRLRRLKNEEEIMKTCEYLIASPEEYKGKWHTLFKNKNEIIIEIGMGKGDFIFEMARNNPDQNYIGIEKYDKVTGRAIKKIQMLPNLYIIKGDAKNIRDWFDSEVNLIYLNHSDPWPKDRHAKRRLTSPNFLEEYKKIFKSVPKISLQTDNFSFFEYSLNSLKDNGYEITLENRNYSDPNKPMTEYEKRYRELGQPIYYIEATLKK